MSRAVRAIALLVLVALSTLAAASSPEAEASCTRLRAMPGVGLVCDRPDGLLDVFTFDGIPVGTSHGPDPVPAPADATALAGTTPACVDGAPGTYYAQVIYARAYDDTDGYASWAPRIRSMVGAANRLVDDAGAATGGRVDIRVKCVGDVIEVRNETLPTARASASFSSIVNDLRAKGYTDGKVKHWVFYDDTGACSCGGMGHLYGDDRPGAENANNGNGAALFAVTFGYDSVRIMLHELGHNLGAVQGSAPRSTGAGHCVDGSDTMCYNDGGPRAGNYTATRCSIEVFDCGKDDYFHANPEPGSYLATHWNLGDRVNRFFRFGQPAVKTLLCDAEVEAGSPLACILNSADESTGVRFGLDWGDGTASSVPDEGYEAPNVLRNATHVYDAPGTYVVRASIVDSDGIVGNERNATIVVHADLTPPTLVVHDPVRGRAYRGCADVFDVPVDRAVWIESGCLRAEAMDTGSGVARVEVAIGGEVLASDDEAPYEMAVPLERGYHLNANVAVRAVDHAGNVATVGVLTYAVAT